MQTSGLVLDVYDDFDGAVLKAVYPTADQLPENIKTAHVLTVQERDQLPDQAFALVLVNNGEKLRKYACVDEGNTLLSIQYFLKNAHKLPLEAQKVAAANLCEAASWFDLEVPEELQKTAFGIGTAMTALTAVPIAKGTAQSIKGNMGAIHGLEGGGHIITPNQLAEAQGLKHAEVAGTPDMPNTTPSSSKPPAVVKKTAELGGDFGPEETEKYDGYTKGKNMERAPQAGVLRPHVDVTNKEAPKVMPEKNAGVRRFALPEYEKYPLDSYAQVKTASSYFDTYHRQLAPAARREFAANLVKRASELEIPVCDLARRYGSDSFAPEAELKMAFDIRRQFLTEDGDRQLLDRIEVVLRERGEYEPKVASAVTPELIAETLHEFDKEAGLSVLYDIGIPDAYYSVLGFEKSAEEDFLEVLDNDVVTAKDLQSLAKTPALLKDAAFDHDFIEEFKKDPVAIFKSMPRPQKKMLARLAQGAQPGNTR